MTQPTVWLVVPRGRAVRLLLRTAILPTLTRAGVNVVILSPLAGDEAFQREFNRPGVRIERARIAEAERFHRVGRPGFGALVRSCVADSRADLSALDHRLRVTVNSLGARRPARARVFARCIALLRRSRALRRLLLAYEGRYAVNHLHRDLFAKYRPDLVVMPTPGYDSPLETELLREARAHGCATAIVVRGWDNPSTKGMMAAVPDRVICWTESMKHEQIAYHNLRPNRAIVAGAPYLDFYYRDADAPSRDEYFASLKLDPARRLIVFVAKLPASYPWNADIVARLADAVAHDRFPVPSQLLVRLYPVSSEDERQRVDLARCRLIAQSHPHVFLSVPHGPSRERLRDMPADDFAELRDLLRHADVLVNVFSTMAIEAAINDLPIVTAGFDGPRALTPADLDAGGRSSRVHAREPHNRRLMSYGGIALARNEHELIAAVGRYLVERSLDADGRRRIVEREVGPNHGTAGEVVGNVLADLARRRHAAGRSFERATAGVADSSQAAGRKSAASSTRVEQELVRGR